MLPKSKRKYRLSTDLIRPSFNANRSVMNTDATPPRSPAFRSKISQIPNLQQYAAIQKLRLGKEALQKIKHSLDIEHVTQVQFQERVKNNDYYINYEKNPFVVEMVPFYNGLLPTKRQFLGDRNIIESVNKLKDKTEFGNINSRIVKEESQSNYIHKIIQDVYRQSQKKRKAKKYSVKNIQEKENLKQEKEINDFDDFQRIINIKQESFYKRENRNKEFNIFKILSNDTDNDFYMSYNILKNVYFCEDSTLTKANSKKISNVFKDISFVARLFIANLHKSVPKDYKLVPADIKAIIQEIKFTDMMQIGSGIVEPEVLQSYLYQETRNTKKGGDQDTSSLNQDQDQIYYNENKQHKSTQFKVERHDKAQIQTYIDHPLSKIQNKQLVLSQQHKQQLLKYLQIQKECKSANIQDRKLLDQIELKKKQILMEQYQGKIRKQSGHIDKIIRFNKRQKDRVDNIKNKVVLETIHVQKSLQKQVRSISKGKNNPPKWR